MVLVLKVLILDFVNLKILLLIYLLMMGLVKDIKDVIYSVLLINSQELLLGNIETLMFVLFLFIVKD